MNVPYTLKRSARSRALRLSVQADGSVVVTAPHFFGLRAIERFIAAHTDWLARKIGAVKKREVIPLARKDIAALKADVQTLKTKLAASELSVSELVSTAWASARSSSAFSTRCRSA